MGYLRVVGIVRDGGLVWGFRSFTRMWLRFFGFMFGFRLQVKRVRVLVQLRGRRSRVKFRLKGLRLVWVVLQRFIRQQIQELGNLQWVFANVWKFLVVVQISGFFRIVGLGGDWVNRQWCFVVIIVFVRLILGYFVYWGIKGQVVVVLSIVVCIESMVLVQEVGSVGVGYILIFQQSVVRQVLVGKGIGVVIVFWG